MRATSNLSKLNTSSRLLRIIPSPFLASGWTVATIAAKSFFPAIPSMSSNPLSRITETDLERSQLSEKTGQLSLGLSNESGQLKMIAADRNFTVCAETKNQT